MDTREHGVKHPALELPGGWAESRSLLPFWRNGSLCCQLTMRTHDKDMNAVRHQIPTGAAPPIGERYRPVPPKLHAELLLDNGAITESSSPWAASLVLVEMKNGTLRFCVD